jgi:hypothetical protein
MLKTIFEEISNIDIKINSIKPDKAENATMEAINKLRFLETDVKINDIEEKFKLVYPSSYAKKSDMKIYPNLVKYERFLVDLIYEFKNDLDRIIPDNIGGYQVYHIYFDKYANRKWNEKLPTVSKGPQFIKDEIKETLKDKLSSEDYKELLEILDGIKVRKSKNIIKLGVRVGSLDDLLSKYTDRFITFQKLCEDIAFNNAKKITKQDVEKYFKYIFSNKDVLEFLKKYE